MCFKTVAVAHWLAGWKMPAWSRFIAGVLAPLRGHKGLKSVRIRCGAPQHLLPSCASNRPLPQKQSWKSETDGCFIAGQLYRVKNKGHMYFSVMGCDSKVQCAPPLEFPYRRPLRAHIAAPWGPILPPLKVRAPPLEVPLRCPSRSLWQKQKKSTLSYFLSFCMDYDH